MATENGGLVPQLGETKGKEQAIGCSEHEIAHSLASAGYKVHLSQGVWWQQTGPSFVKPVNPMKAIEPGEAFPAYFGSLLGYSHVVADPNQANWFRSVMLLNEENLSDFGFGKLNRGKRSSVRKALRNLVIQDITELEPHLELMAEICTSQASRNAHGQPPEYYVKHYPRWAAFMRREFSIPGRIWLGAFLETRLVGYYYAYVIDGTMYISAAKSHTAALNMRLNEGMVFTLLERGQADANCRRVIFGDWSDDAPSLNKFKESFGFRRWDVPVFRRLRWPARLVLLWRSLPRHSGVNR